MAGDILALDEKLVSPWCGVIRRLHRVHKDPLEPRLPFIWRAELANHQFGEAPHRAAATASGKGLTEAEARRGAMGEAVERYSALRHPDSALRIARADELPGRVLDPAALVLYAKEQYEALPYDPYDPAGSIGWVPGRSLADGAAIWLPAQPLYLGYRSERADVLCQPTSNGLAAGPTEVVATLRALLEVVERDAFVIAWCNRLAARRVAWDDHPDQGVVAVARSYERRGVAVELIRLPTDHDIPVFAALGVEERPGGVAAVVGLGADVAPARAAAAAILEVAQVRPALRMKLRDPELRERRERLVDEPSSVSELEDHDLLYTDGRMLPAFDFWRTGPIERADWSARPGGPEAALAGAVASLAAAGAQAHVHDLTPADISSLGLRAVRVVVEGFQPIHFGHREIRLGGSRLYEVPHRIGARRGPSTPGALNPLPHPLS